MEPLQGLFDLLTESMREKIQSGDVTAKDWDVIRNFLKDNGIQAKAAPGTNLKSLIDSLPDFDDGDEFDQTFELKVAGKPPSR